MINVLLDGMQTLTNMTQVEKDAIKSDLTIPNPAYEQIKKFSRYGYTSAPPYLTYYYSINGDLIVPRGYEIPFDYKVIEDNRAEVKVEYPKFKLGLRDTQREAFEAWNETREKGMIVLQTGKGKSILGIFLGYITRQKTLVIVQKNDLVDGWTKDIYDCLGLEKSQIGLIKAQKRDIGKQFTLATIQTLNKLNGDELKKLYSTFGMVIVDECHHASSESYEILKYFKCKYLLGLTATDMRGDGLGQVMYWNIGGVCYRSVEDENDEDIMPYTVKIRESNIKYNPPTQYYYGKAIVSEETANELMKAGKHVKRVPLDSQVIRALLRDKNFNQMVAQDIVHEYKNKKSCIVFLHEKEHIRDMRDLLVSKGVPEDQIQLYYGDSKEDEGLMKNRAESKEVLITIATFSKATEGTNIKALERAFLVTSINDLKNTIQAVGRCRRRKEGKPDVIIYDYEHPKAKGLSNHINTRLKAYRDAHAKIIRDGVNVTKSTKSGTLTRGWIRK